MKRVLRKWLMEKTLADLDGLIRTSLLKSASEMIMRKVRF